MLLPTLVSLLLGLLQQVAIADGIVVERNVHTYFKLPLKAIGMGDKSGIKNTSNCQHYHILQCPRVSSTAILKPQDMPICMVTGRYTDETKPVRKSAVPAVKIRSPLHTQVDYQHLKKRKRVEPINQATQAPLVNSSGCNSDSAVRRRNVSTRRREARDSSKRNLSTEVDATDASRESSEDHEEDRHSAEAEQTDFDDYSGSEEVDSRDEPITPFQFLGVQNIIKRMNKHIGRAKAAIIPDKGDFSAEAKSFFANNEEFEKGDKWRGHQTTFHRDELFDDHIFYDDGKQFGDFAIHAKTHERSF